MFTRPPSAKELTNTGLRPEDYDEHVEVWPENWAVWQLFCKVRTQWLSGAGGPIGLNHQVVFRLLDDLRLDQATWDDYYADIRVIEDAALAAIHQATESS